MKKKNIDGKDYPVQNVNGNEVPVIPATAKEVVKNKRTGKIYASKDEFEKDVSDPLTDTKQEDFSQDVEITVASLKVFGKTKL